jgi:hypothetical protein
MKDKYKKFYMMFDKKFKNLILCSNLNCDRGVIYNTKLDSAGDYIVDYRDSLRLL